MSKLDTEESCIVISESKRIYIHEKDVGIVFGIPCGDMDIASAETSPEQLDLIKTNCGLTGSRSFKILESVLQKHLDDKSSRQQVDRFKIAFVIYVMGHLFVPSVKHDHGNTDFWGALKDPDLIHIFNWCRYVYTYVLEGAKKVRDEVIRKGRVTKITGCHLFLQVSSQFSALVYYSVPYYCDHICFLIFLAATIAAFLMVPNLQHVHVLYLDNISFPLLDKKHDTIPHIKVFDQESLKRMTTSCACAGEREFTDFMQVCLSTFLPPYIVSIDLYMFIVVYYPVQIRSAESSAYMRRTYESEHVTGNPAHSKFAANLPSNQFHSTNVQGCNPGLTPDTFEFNGPADFGAYIRAKHPSLVMFLYLILEVNFFISPHNSSHTAS
jgi:hypothetical protein